MSVPAANSVQDLGNGLEVARATAGDRFGVGADNDTKYAASQAIARKGGGAANQVVNPNAPDPGSTAFWNSVAPGMTQDQIAQALRKMPADQASKLETESLQYAQNVDNPDPWYDSVLQKLALGTSVAAVTAGLATWAAPAISAAAGGAAGTVGGGAAGTIASGVVTGAADSAIAGAVGDVLTEGGKNIGTSALHGAEVGAVTGGISSAIGASGASQSISNSTGLPSNYVSAGLNTVGKLAASEALGGSSSPSKAPITQKTNSEPIAGRSTSAIPGSTLTSPTGQSATSTGSGSKFEASSELSPGVAPLAVAGATMAGTGLASTIAQPTALAPGVTSADPNQGSAGSGSFLGDMLTGAESTLGGGSLGQSLGTLLPYAGVAAIGEAQAKAGQAQDAKASQQQQALAQPAIGESNALLGQYQSGTLNKADQAVVDTGVKQGQSTIASANGLSAIAQTAFANYNSGKLNAGDQAALDATVASQKQQVAQQLASAGITDSTILAAQNQQIDNQALISKQNTLNSYFNTGNAAYNSWLTATTEGQQTITQAQTYASTSLNNYLSASMAEAGIGIGEVNTAIQTQMTTDANYANQVSTLLGTLATAYAKQIAGQKASGGSSAGNAVGNAAGTAVRSALGGGSSGGGSGGNDVGGVANPSQVTGDITDINQNSDPFLYQDINSSGADLNFQVGQQLSDETSGFLGDIGDEWQP